MAKPARRTRKLRTRAKPPNTRGRTPIQDNMTDSFIGFPKILRGGPDSGEHVLAETFFEFRLERLQRVKEGLAVDLLDDFHAAVAQLVELRGIKLRLPGDLGRRPGRPDPYPLIPR